MCFGDFVKVNYRQYLDVSNFWFISNKYMIETRREMFGFLKALKMRIYPVTTFDDREKAFESKFAHDEEIMFKVRARRNRLFGEWVAAELGITGDDVSAYAGDVVAADLEEEGDDDIMRKVAADYDAKNVAFNADTLSAKLNDFLSVAKEQIMSE
jgi:hypothetical protein